jgi:Mannosylglycerate hydrolase MGH1-like glycoside hydrolase domain/Glycosyl hydrolase family 63 C-terminal domain
MADSRARGAATTPPATVEQRRLEEVAVRTSHWRRWGPYLADRQWGTVREDYSADGHAWDYLPHDHARSRAYRWGEDGILGISDNHQRLCFAVTLWNGRDPILKERYFGLTGSQGNHGEDVKEYYFYLDATPTHSYMKGLYKYPQGEFPYARLIEENGGRGRREREFELLDSGIFQDGRYFDVAVEYAKAAPEDILVRITVSNRGPETAPVHVLPTLWFRNTWAWDHGAKRPRLARDAQSTGKAVLAAHPEMEGTYRLACEGEPELLFTENDSNAERLYGTPNSSPYVKDAFGEYLVHGRTDAVNPLEEGTKAAAHYALTLGAGASAVLRLRLTREGMVPTSRMFEDFDRVFDARRREADDFYARVAPDRLAGDSKDVMRQALAGMLWSKQWFHFDVRRWLEGDPTQPPPPPERKGGRNAEWTHLYNDDVVSMPDKWEYPWYAAWDLAFHTISLALVDPDFAKEQLILFLREWYMHPNGQIPAYEWNFGDVNPPVHAWAALRVYKIEKRIRGKADRRFLERVFQKLLLNFTWWINRKDPEGKNVFQGGFLGLDNIGVFDRSAPLPTGGHIEQSDGTAWMGMFCLNMLGIALELAREDPTYEDMASKFFEHFMYIAQAMSHMGHKGIELWNEEDGFFYDVLHTPDGTLPMKVRSLVGLVPLFAVQVIEPEDLERLPSFNRRLRWFLDNREDLCHLVTRQVTSGGKKRRLLSLVSSDRLERVLGYMLDEREFLSPYGIRALSQYHRDHAYVLNVNGMEHRVDYEPAESSTGLFGGNSNWRGPIWFPMNFLLVESLQRFDYFFGEQFQVEFPTGSGTRMRLWDVAAELSRRLTAIFLRGADGQRPVHGGFETFQQDPHWKDLVLFYEYFHGDNGAGIGASHQTGWTGLVAKLLQQSGR